MKKRFMALALSMLLAAPLAGCNSAPAASGDAAASVDKIGVMTGTVSQGEEE